MNWVLRSLFVVIIAAIAAVATAPLGFVMDRLGASSAGLRWGQVQGTIWSGRVSNVTFGGQLVGDLDLRLKPSGLLSGMLAYDLTLSGPVAAGTATVYASGQDLGVRDANMTGRVDQLVGLNASVRKAGGSVRLRNVDLVLDRQFNCASASGNLWTEVLVNLGADYGESLPELEGGISCSGPMLAIGLDGLSDTGTGVEIDAIVGMAAPSSLNARISGASGEIAQALGALGFTVAGDDFVYVRELGP